MRTDDFGSHPSQNPPTSPPFHPIQHRQIYFVFQRHDDSVHRPVVVQITPRGRWGGGMKYLSSETKKEKETAAAAGNSPDKRKRRRREKGDG